MVDDPERGYLVTLTFRSDPSSMELPGLRTDFSSNRAVETCRLHNLGVESIIVLKHRTEYAFRITLGFRDSAFREGEENEAYEAALRAVERLISYRFLPRGLRRIPPSSVLYCSNSGVPTRYDGLVDDVRAIGRYHFLASQPQGGLNSSNSVMLDTNVLIDMERFFYSSIPAESRRDLHMLLLALLEKDVLPGLALAESCRTRLMGPLDYAKAARSQHAFRIMSRWSAEELVRMFERNRPPAELYPSPPPLDPNEFTSNGGMILDLFQIGGLTALLKIQTLTPSGRGFAGPDERLAALRKFARWVIDSLEFVMPHEFQLAHDWFVGPPNRRTYVQRLLRFGRKDAINATWAAVWDLTFLKFVDSVPLMDPSFGNQIVVTKDLGLSELRRYCYSSGMELIDGDPEAPRVFGPTYATSIAVDPRWAYREDEITEIWAEVARGQMLRIAEAGENAIIGMEEKINRWRREAQHYEDELRRRAKKEGK
jgi:hypothetical protein